MAFTIASKVAIGSSLIGLLGYFGKEYILGNTIADLIKKHNPERQLISSTTSLYSQKWKEAWNRYLDDNRKRERDIWELGDWNAKLISSKKHEPVPISFIDACDSFSQRSVLSTSNSLYKEVLKWCTSSWNQKISELIKEKGKRILNEFDSKEDLNFGWKAALIKYLSISSNPLDIDNFEKDKDSVELSKDKPVFLSFVKKCNELGEKSVGVTEIDLSRAVEHCSVTRTVKDLINEDRPDRAFVDVSKIKDNTSPVAIELWTNYLNSNKDRGQDDWNIGHWEEKNRKATYAPDGFFKQCKDRSSKVALIIDPKIISELIRYCTHDVNIVTIYQKATNS